MLVEIGFDTAEGKATKVSRKVGIQFLDSGVFHRGVPSTRLTDRGDVVEVAVGGLVVEVQERILHLGARASSYARAFCVAESECS